MVDALPAGSRAEYRDRDLPAFGVAVDGSGAKAYFVEIRGKRVALGRHGAVSAGRARLLATAALARGGVRGGRERAGEAGNRPLRRWPTQRFATCAILFATVANLQQSRSTAGPSRITSFRPWATCRSRRSGRATWPTSSSAWATARPPPTPAVSTLSRLIRHAAELGLAPPGRDPCRFARRYRVRRRERFLTGPELRRLGAALDSLEAEKKVSAHAAAAIRLLVLTGCRRNEILTLRWDDLRPDAGEIRLRDSKTGPRTVCLSPAAARVFAGIPRLAGSPWVFPGRKPGTCASGIFGPWGPGPRTRRAGRFADPRFAPFLREPRARARRKPARHRPAARPRRRPDHRALRPSRARRGPAKPPPGSRPAIGEDILCAAPPPASPGVGGGRSGRRAGRRRQAIRRPNRGRHRRGHPAPRPRRNVPARKPKKTACSFSLSLGVDTVRPRLVKLRVQSPLRGLNPRPLQNEESLENDVYVQKIDDRSRPSRPSDLGSRRAAAAGAIRLTHRLRHLQLHLHPPMEYDVALPDGHGLNDGMTTIPAGDTVMLPGGTRDFLPRDRGLRADRFDGRGDGRQLGVFDRRDGGRYHRGDAHGG